jgi:two-component system sensor histidine kinase MprB
VATRMSFRARITLAAAAAVAVAIAALAISSYVIVRNALLDQVDASLRDTADDARLVALPDGTFIARLPAGPLGTSASGIVSQVVRASGSQLAPPGEVPVTAGDRLIASGASPPEFRTTTVQGVRVRTFVRAIAPGFAVLVGRPLAEVESTLGRIRLVLILGAVFGVGCAALLGALVARSALVPVRRLTAAAEEVARTTDLSQRIDIGGDDELSRLAVSVNRMLASLERAVRSQRELVADASHELRTPLTSVRTNVELLARTELPAAERRRLLGDAVGQLEELSVLVSDVVELARDGERQDELEDVRLDLLVADAVERVERRAADVSFQLDLEPTLVSGVPARLDRAVVNLLDNAVAWSPPGEPVEVSVRNGTVAVRDHGPGVAAEDLDRVFDRFYRAPAARGKAGSGLGLAIVRQVAEAHGGAATVEQEPDGGVRFRFALPVEVVSEIS